MVSITLNLVASVFPASTMSFQKKGDITVECCEHGRTSSESASLGHPDDDCSLLVLLELPTDQRGLESVASASQLGSP